MATQRISEVESVVLPRQLSMTERFHCVLYPFDLLILLDNLPAIGWIVSEAMDETQDARHVSVPVKGNNRLRIDQGNKTLGVGGKIIEEVLAGYREVRTLAREVSPLSPEVTTHYVEFRYIGRVGATGSSEAFAQFWNENGQIGQLSELLGQRLPSTERMLPYGVRLATVAPDANRPNWSELSIQPVTVSGTVGYQFDLIYRHEDSAAVEQVAERAEETIRDAIALIEGQRSGRRSNR